MTVLKVRIVTVKAAVINLINRQKFRILRLPNHIVVGKEKGNSRPTPEKYNQAGTKNTRGLLYALLEKIYSVLAVEVLSGKV